jgi:hypothetical protein
MLMMPESCLAGLMVCFTRGKSPARAIPDDRECDYGIQMLELRYPFEGDIPVINPFLPA